MVKAIKDLIPTVLQHAMAQHEKIQQLQRRWASLVGRQLAAHTRPVSLRRGRLYVNTNEPGASFALNLEKTRLLEQLHKAPYHVEDIVIRAGELPG